MRALAVVLAGLLFLALPSGAATVTDKPQEKPRAWLGITLASPDFLERQDAIDDDASDVAPDDVDRGADAPAPAAAPNEAPKGALVTAIVRDGPADRAGLRSGDVIQRVGGTEITSPDVLTQTIATSAPGDWVELAFTRRGKDRTASVRLGLRSDDTRLDLRRPYAGLVPIDVPLQLKKHWGGSEKQGVLVGEVNDGGPAARAGIQPGDLVLAIDGKPVARASLLISRLQLGGIGNTVTLLISRQGTRLEAGVELDDQPQKNVEQRVNPSPRAPRHR